MNYRTKRIQNKFNKSYLAYKLGISEKDYQQIELGIKGISADKLELLSEIYANPQKYKLEQNQLRQNANIWYDSIDNLEDEFNKFGYTRQDIAYALNCSLTKIWDYVNKHVGRIGEDGKLQFYLFLTNENNRKYPSMKHKEEFRKEEKNMNYDPRFYYEPETNTTLEKTPQEIKSDNIDMIGFKEKIDYLRKQLEVLKTEKDKIFKDMMLYKIRSEAYEKALMNMYN